MATVGLAITNLQQTPGQMPAQADVSLGPRANATPAQGLNDQQDTVTLTGQTGESQQSGSGSGSAQFGEAAAFFFAESQTFRAANGSGGNQTAKPANVPQLPVKAAQEPDVGQTHDPADDMQGPTVAPAGDTFATTANGSSAAAGSTSAAADTPLAELSQLDTTLQQMGINPQSISLFNRMAMLLYSHDPAALRVLVQTLQQGAQEPGVNSNSESGAPQVTSQSALQPLLPGQLQGPAPTESQPQNAQSGSAGGEAQAGDAQLQQAVQSNDAAQGLADLAISAQGGSPISLAAQFGELRSIFALSAGNGAPSAAAGGVLDVTA